MTDQKSPDLQRLDKWLKTVRLFKTRKLAAEACEGRLVKVNDVTSKPGKTVKPGDEIIIRKQGKYRSFRILGISHRSIAAKIARELYEETTPETLTPEEKEMVELQRRMTKSERSKFPGRPTKKNMREIMKIKYGE